MGKLTPQGFWDLFTRNYQYAQDKQEKEAYYKQQVDQQVKQEQLNLLKFAEQLKQNESTRRYQESMIAENEAQTRKYEQEASTPATPKTYQATEEIDGIKYRMVYDEQGAVKSKIRLGKGKTGTGNVDDLAKVVEGIEKVKLIKSAKWVDSEKLQNRGFEVTGVGGGYLYNGKVYSQEGLDKLKESKKNEYKGSALKLTAGYEDAIDDWGKDWTQVYH